MKSFGDPKHISFSFANYIYDLDFQQLTAGKYILGMIDDLLWTYSKDHFYAGVLIPHNERKKHEDGTECTFKNYYEYGKLVYCQLPHVWEWGPHVHFLGYTFIVPDGKKFYELTDCIYVNIEDEGYRDIRATAFYLLTHAANYQNNITGKCTAGYRFVGLFANKLVKLDKTVSSDELCLCGIDGCRCPLHKFKPTLDKNMNIVEDPYLEIDEGEIKVKKKIKYWRLKDKLKQEKL